MSGHSEFRFEKGLKKKKDLKIEIIDVKTKYFECKV